MRIVLAKCSQYSSIGFHENSESLALGYLGAYLRRKGFKVDLLNGSLRHLSSAQISAELLKNEYALIGFSIAAPSLFQTTIEVIRNLRQNGVVSHICVGGHPVTFNYQEILENYPEIDSTVLFEGEETIYELAQAIKNNQELKSIAGIAFLYNGAIVKNHKRINSFGINQLPFPARDDLSYVIQEMPDIYTIPILGSRGCYFNCSFCSIPAFYKVNGKSIRRQRTVSNVLDEIEEIIIKY